MKSSIKKTVFLVYDKICIDINMEQTERSLPQHNVEKNATNLHN